MCNDNHVHFESYFICKPMLDNCFWIYMYSENETKFESYLFIDLYRGLMLLGLVCMMKIKLNLTHNEFVDLCWGFIRRKTPHL